MLVRRLSPLIAVLSIAAAGTVAVAGTGDGAPAPRAVKCAGSKATLKGTKGDDLTFRS